MFRVSFAKIGSNTTACKNQFSDANHPLGINHPVDTVVKNWADWRKFPMQNTTKKNSEFEVKTSALLRGLVNTPDLEKFIECNADEMDMPAFHIYITNLCKTTNQVPEQIIKRADIERTYGHQLFNGTRKPSRDKVIQLAFGLRLDLNSTQKLLQVAEKNPLYPKIKRDAAIIYCINHQKGILEIQSVLQELGLTLLGGA